MAKTSHAQSRSSRLRSSPEGGPGTRGIGWHRPEASDQRGGTSEPEGQGASRQSQKTLSTSRRSGNRDVEETLVGPGSNRSHGSERPDHHEGARRLQQTQVIVQSSISRASAGKSKEAELLLQLRRPFTQGKAGGASSIKEQAREQLRINAINLSANVTPVSDVRAYGTTLEQDYKEQDSQMSNANQSSSFNPKLLSIANFPQAGFVDGATLEGAALPQPKKRRVKLPKSPRARGSQRRSQNIVNTSAQANLSTVTSGGRASELYSVVVRDGRSLEGLDELMETIANQTFQPTLTRESATLEDGRASPGARALANALAQEPELQLSSFGDPTARARTSAGHYVQLKMRYVQPKRVSLNDDLPAGPTPPQLPVNLYQKYRQLGAEIEAMRTGDVEAGHGLTYRGKKVTNHLNEIEDKRLMQHLKIFKGRAVNGPQPGTRTNQQQSNQWDFSGWTSSRTNDQPAAFRTQAADPASVGGSPGPHRGIQPQVQVKVLRSFANAPAEQQAFSPAQDHQSNEALAPKLVSTILIPPFLDDQHSRGPSGLARSRAPDTLVHATTAQTANYRTPIHPVEHRVGTEGTNY